MIPYFPEPVIYIGPLALHAFSVLVIVAILMGRGIVARRAQRLQLDRQAMAAMCISMLCAGFVTAHFAKIILPNIPVFLAEPSMALRSTGGITSLAGLGGGLLGGIVWNRMRGLNGFETLRMLDVIAYALPFAWIFGRFGCFLAHDHRGLYTTGWIGVQFPEGTRFDLGLIELLFLIAFASLFHILNRRPRPAGFFFGMYGVVYGLYRVFQDTLHIQPASYWNGRHGDTIGGAITCLVGLAGWALMARHSHRHSNDDARRLELTRAPASFVGS